MWEKDSRHDIDIHDAVYKNYEIHGHKIRGSGQRVGVNMII